MRIEALTNERQCGQLVRGRALDLRQGRTHEQTCAPNTALRAEGSASAQAPPVRSYEVLDHG